MAKKKIGAYLDAAIADELDRAAELFDGQKSELIAAALVMFLRAPEAERRDALKAVMLEKIDRFFELRRPPTVRTAVFDAPASAGGEEPRQLQPPRSPAKPAARPR